MLAVIHIVCYHVITVCFKIAVTERKKKIQQIFKQEHGK